MSCRTSAAGSLATTYVQRLYGLEDAQCTSMFHELVRDHARSSQPPITRADYENAIERMENTILHDDRWSPAMRERALRRVRIARSVPDMPSQATAAAMIGLQGAAGNARARLDSVFGVIAGQHGVPRDAVEAEFSRLYRGYDGGRAGAQGLSAGLPRGLPGDPSTTWAIHTLITGTRCPSCGQFTPRDGAHTCPTTPGAATGRGPRPSAAIPTQPVPPGEVMPPSGEVAPTQAEPWSATDFQGLYDEARARFIDGDYRVPRDLDLETVPGAVTGGLGARDGGTSFGLEIEIDFPDDEYPYQSRYLLAQRLHEAGVTESPRVMRWHHVGDGGRPGGTYEVNPDNWVCEFDRSVDDCDGERGVEIKSQILYDEPRTWENLATICRIAEELGGKPTMRTGLHVNVGGRGFDSSDPAAHNALLRLASAYDDTIVRLAHNPESGPTHRGRNYCQHVHVPPAGFSDVSTAKAYSNHYQAFNLGHLPERGDRMRSSSRVEHRIWDSTLDPGRIQAAVTVSLAMVRHAVNGRAPGQDAEPAGTHKQMFEGRRLEGEEWETSTESFRRLVTLVGEAGADSEHHRRALTTMFAASRWQNR